MRGALGRRWTFAELDAEAERLALALASRYAPGERICVWAPNLPEWVIVEFAAARAGLTLVTANPAYRPRELRFVLEQSRSVGLFIAPAHRGTPMAEIAAEVAAELPALREVVDITDADQLFALGAGAPRPAARAARRCGADPVHLRHHRLSEGCAAAPPRPDQQRPPDLRPRRGAASGETVLNFMPMFHTSGCACLTLGAVELGCRTIIAALFDPGADAGHHREREAGPR